jgi:hypothetical protein
MARMTEEEANALDEAITNADITLKPGKGGIFTRQRDLLNAQDRSGDNPIEIEKESADVVMDDKPFYSVNSAKKPE